MLDNPNPTVAYRHRFGKRLTYTDKEIVCAPCAQPDDTRIVLRSENGQRIKTGQIKCAVCTKPIKVVS